MLLSDWSYIFVLAGFVLYFPVIESYSPIFLDPKALDTLLVIE